MRARIAASVVLAVGVAVGTAGCGFITPQTTLKAYVPSDGVNGNVGDIAVRDALLITNDGTNANLVVTLVNSDSRSHRLEVQHGPGSAQKNTFVTVPADDTIKVGSTVDGPSVVFRNVNIAPGSLYPVYFQYADQPGVQLKVPVLTGELEAYSTLTPTPLPTPAPTKVISPPAPVPTATPGATETPTATPAP